MCNQIVKDKIASVVNNMINVEKVESFDAMSIFNGDRWIDAHGHTTHKEVNIELTTMYHAGKMPRYIVCVPRPVPNSGMMHRVYLNTRIKQAGIEGKSAHERDENIKAAIARLHGDDVNPTEASRRLMEAIIYGGFQPS
jgi:hypothetical protein